MQILNPKNREFIGQRQAKELLKGSAVSSKVLENNQSREGCYDNGRPLQIKLAYLNKPTQQRNCISVQSGLGKNAFLTDWLNNTSTRNCTKEPLSRLWNLISKRQNQVNSFNLKSGEKYILWVAATIRPKANSPTCGVLCEYPFKMLSKKENTFQTIHRSG